LSKSASLRPGGGERKRGRGLSLPFDLPGKGKEETGSPTERDLAALVIRCAPSGEFFLIKKGGGGMSLQRKGGNEEATTFLRTLGGREEVPSSFPRESAAWKGKGSTCGRSVMKEERRYNIFCSGKREAVL